MPDRTALSGHPADAARVVLGCILVIGDTGLRARITEVEAYGGPPDSPWPDPGAHSFPGLTERNRAMFGPAGHLYVYLSYGMHHCANITAGPDGTGAGVLLRAAEILSGADAARRRRERGDRGVATHQLARGPGNLGRALGLDLHDYGLDLLDPASRVRLEDGGPVRGGVAQGPRVGLRGASARPWRFWLAGEPSVSAYRRHRNADGLG